MKDHSWDKYFEIYYRTENLENELSELKKEASFALEEAIMQRKDGFIFSFKGNVP